MATESQTQNKPRQKVLVSYSTHTEFKVPEGIDLNNKEQVENWCVKWGTLYIRLVGKEELVVVEEEYEPETDWKFPETTEVTEDSDEEE